MVYAQYIHVRITPGSSEYVAVDIWGVDGFRNSGFEERVFRMDI